MERDFKEPKFIVENGKPAAKITDIDDYREMLEMIEDAEACAVLDRMRREPTQFRPFEEYLAMTRR